MSEQLVIDALARVFGDGTTFVVRPDTPLSSFGPIEQAWVMLAQAIFEATAASGFTVELADEDICAIQTVGELAQLVDHVTGAGIRATP